MLGLGTSIVRGGAVSEDLLFDEFSNSTYTGWSIRKLTEDYNGPCVRVRRASDNAERDIYFDTNDTLDTTALESFCAGTDGYVVRWYNQMLGLDSSTLLSNSYATGATAAYSVRKLSNTYDAPAMEVASSDDVIGFRMTSDQVDAGNLGLEYTDATAYSGGALTFTLEIYVDAPSHIEENKNVRFRLQMLKSGGGVTLSGYTNIQPSKQKKWQKVELTFSETPVEHGFIFVQDRNNGTDLLKGEQIVIRNIEATGYTASYDQANYSIVNFADEAEVTKGYNIPFTTDGQLDEAKIVEYGYASPLTDLEISVADLGDGILNSVGNYYVTIPAAPTVTDPPSASGTYTVAIEMYVDCPSIAGDVSFKGQIGAATKNFDEGNTVPQKQWVTRTMSATVSDTNVASRLYFAGTSQVVQQMRLGDNFYIRKVTLNHAEDSSYNAEFEFGDSAEGFTVINPSAAEAVLTYAKAPAEELGVTTWYDQSGNGNDATQTTFANTPKIYQYNSTTKDYRVTKEGGSPATKWAGGAQALETTYTTNSSEFTVVAVAQCDANATNKTVVLVPEALIFYQAVEDARHIQGDAFQTPYTASNFTDHAIHFVGNSGSESFAGENGDTFTTRAESTATNGELKVGNNGNGTIAFEGSIQEIVYYTSDKSANRTSIEDNVKGYYRVYDDLDLVQTTDASQPQIVSSGVTIKQGSLPALQMADNTVTLTIPNSTGDFKFLHDGTSSNMLWVFTPYDAYPTSSVEADEPFETGKFAASVGVETTLRVGPIDGSGDRNSIEIAIKDGQGTKALYPAVSKTANNSLPAGQNILGVALDGNSLPADARIRVYINDGAVIRNNTNTGTPSAADSSHDFTILGGFTTAGIDTYWQEFLVWNGNTFLNNSGGVIRSVNEFYNTYGTTRLLDAHPDAAAAYSLRKLRHAYSGDAVLVRRDSDDAELAIGFTLQGDLDTTALNSFCSGANGYVKTWYDQSSNGNDATQATPELQPKIYDATTGLLTQGGKPIVTDNDATTAYLSASVSLSTGNYAFGVVRGDSDYFNFINGDSDQEFLFVGQDGVTSSSTGGVSNLTTFVNGSSTSLSTRDAVHDQFRDTQGLITAGFDMTTNTVTLGYSFSTSVGMTSTQELIIYDSDQSGSRSDIETNINEYYSIY